MNSKPALQMQISEHMRLKVAVYQLKDFQFVVNYRVQNLSKAGFNHANGNAKIILCPSISGKLLIFADK